MASKSQRWMSALVLGGAVTFGMYIANPASGQVPVYNESGLPMMANPSSPEKNVRGGNQQQDPNAGARAAQQQRQQEQQDAMQAQQRKAMKQQKKAQKALKKSLNAAKGAKGGKDDGDEDFTPSAVETYTSSSSNNGDPRAVFHTSLGSFRVRLYASRAPATVRNFIGLARGETAFTDVHSGKKQHRPFYNGLTFYRAMDGYMIATGCPYGTGRGGPGFNIPDELSSGVRFDRPGLLAMAPELKGTEPIPNTNGSQLFITLNQMPEWDGKYTIFGEVESGLEVVQKISRVPVGPTSRPIKRVFVTQVDILDEDTANAVPAPGAPTPDDE